MKKMLLAIIVASGVAFTLFAKLDLIPMPREIAMTDGVCTNAAAPKVERVDGIPAEGYELSVRPDGVTIRASDAAGEFYARQTLVQLADSASASVPCCEIRDSPRFKWRGVHLDDVRHFMGKETVKRTIDEIAKCKFNVFHWHLTDDQSWRIDVPGYPELLDYGDQYLADEGQLRFPDGPRAARRYYTKDDIREIADYAALRHVKIVPEIDFPGHFYAVACAYQEFVCNPGNVEAQGRWPMVTGFKEGCDPMCIGNPDAVKFILAALDAVCDLFPDSDVVHIGGDECRFGYWKDCPKCRALMEREGMCDPRELQAWLTRRVVGHLAERGRRAIGWDEMLDAKDGALPASTMGMRWHPKGAERTARAAANGHEIVNCNNRFCYFDYSQGLDGDAHRYLGKRKVALETVYSFDPLAEFPEKAKGRVIGGQCNNWTEFTFNGNDLEWKLWPRALAMSEVLWTYPDPKKRDFADFERRAKVRRAAISAGCGCVTRTEAIREKLVSGDRDYVFVAMHRGDWRNFPENSKGAILSSIALGADIVELDVQMTKDGRFILNHDATLNRTTTGKGKVSDLTLEEIKQFKMRDSRGKPTDYEILTLEEALELTRGKIIMNIDKFTEHPREILDAVAAVGALKEVLVKSLHDPDDARKFFGPYWKDVESGKLLYMPVIQFCWKKHKKAAHDLPLWLAEEPRKASMYEVCADAPEHAAAFGDVLKAKGAPRLWINTMLDSLSAGHGDSRALLDPEANWGWVLDRGATMIQTDYAAELIVWLTQKGRRNF